MKVKNNEQHQDRLYKRNCESLYSKPRLAGSRRLRKVAKAVAKQYKQAAGDGITLSVTQVNDYGKFAKHENVLILSTAVQLTRTHRIHKGHVELYRIGDGRKPNHVARAVSAGSLAATSFRTLTKREKKIAGIMEGSTSKNAKE